MSFDPITQHFLEQASEPIKCWCGTQFIIGASLMKYYEDKGGEFALHCPLGHQFVPGRSSEAARLRDELTREKHRTEQARADAEYQSKRRAFAERRARAARGQVTKIKNRVKNGVCPVCNRTFGDLARHMHGQHPHFGEVDA